MTRGEAASSGRLTTEALLGEGATVVLRGQKVAPSAVLRSGYKFKYERIDDALKNILR